MADARSQIHEMGLKLAEEGRYAEALEHIREHLRRFPKDHQALNDVGVILFCMGANEEAIDHLERAKACCPAHESGEVNWNLCEAYLAAGYPGPAMKLFDEMERQEILNPDQLNRGANVCLLHDMYGHAIELLIRSLEIVPSQEILKPMIEVIRSRRPKVAVFASAKNEHTQGLFEFVGQRFPASLHTGAGRDEMQSRLQQCDIALFDGCWDTMVDVSYLPTACKIIVCLEDSDVYGDAAANICWRNVDAVVVTDNPTVRQRLLEWCGDLDRQARVVTLGRGVDTRRFGITDRTRGKRIACLDDLSLRNNPMMLLQCMQKLHYIDPDYRLYFTGRFADAAAEDYVRHMVDELELSGVVFFDSGIRNEAGWLRDKHYVVTAAIDGGGLPGVLKGMSCGLKPVVHTFPGAREMFNDEFLFRISEDFCNQILSERYEPRRYRQIIEERYSESVRFKKLNDLFFRLEKEIARKDAVTLPKAQSFSTTSGQSSFEMGHFPTQPERPACASDTFKTARSVEPLPLSFHEIGTAETPFHSGAPELPGIARPEPLKTASSTPNAARHLFDRVSSINQMSADILRDWKAFAENAQNTGADERTPISGDVFGELQPAEAVLPQVNDGFTGGGLKITEVPTRNGAAKTAAEARSVPFV